MLAVQNIGLKTWLIVPGALATLLFGGLGLFQLGRSRDEAYRLKEEQTQRLVEAAYSILQNHGQLAASGKMSEAAARAEALAEIKALRYGADGYFWINDLAPRMVMHPTKPALDGKDLSTNKDPNGVPLFLRMVDVCQKRGEGFVHYQWPKPGAEKPVDKVSFVKLYRPWGWIIGSGIYVDDVDAAVHANSLLSMGLFALMVLVFGPASVWLTNVLARPVETIAERLHSAARNVSSATSGIQAASEQIVEGAAGQASEMLAAHKTLECLGSAVGETAADAARADVLIGEVRTELEDGRDRMEALSKAMQGISVTSKQVAQISASIDEIAFQTNLLALNAAVEAARAGESGAGFAVVADEVRNLASKASDAARQSAERIEESLRWSRQAAEISTEVALSFDSVAGRIQTATRHTATIATTARQGQQQVQSLQGQMELLQQRVQSDVERCQATAQAALSLQAEAARLEDSVAPLITVVQGAARARTFLQNAG